MAPLFPPSRLTVVGHRGLSKYPTTWGGRVHRANTIAGFLAAYDCGARWVELDVHTTSDLRLALVHDETLPSGIVIGGIHSQDELHGVELLVDLLAVLPADTGVVIDVKPSLSDLPGRRLRSTYDLVLEAIETDRLRSPERPLLVYGDIHALPFVLGRLRDARSLDFSVGVFGEHDTSLIGATATAIEAGADVVALHTTSYLGRLAGPPYCAATPAETMEVGHSHGIQYLAWVPAPEQIPALAAMGVDAVCVDDLPRTLASLENPPAALVPLQRRPGSSLPVTARAADEPSTPEALR